MAEIPVELTVNGQPIQALVDSKMRLMDFLRDHLRLTGTKEGCGEGVCGSCTVLLDDEPEKSCLIRIAKANGRKVVTIEGLAEKGVLHPVQESFIEHGACQCGFCIPGMIMSAAGLLNKNSSPSRDEIRQALSENLCRCTGYVKMFDAIEAAAAKLPEYRQRVQAEPVDGQDGKVAARVAAIRKQADEDTKQPDSYIGVSLPRLDAKGKVTGATLYAADLYMPGMLHIRALRSPHPHARIKSIDTSEAEAMPGVHGVVTAKDVPGLNGYGVFMNDQPYLVPDKVRFVGDTIAAVAAETDEIAKRAVSRIKVEYELLPAVFDPEDALKPGAPVIHDEFPNNLLKHVKIRKGDIEAGFAQAALIVEEVYQTQPIEHAYLEPEAGVAYLDQDDTLVIMAPGQNITHHRKLLAQSLGLPHHKLRLIMTTVGGGFGGKEDITVQGILALLTLKTGRPTKYVFTRKESFMVSAKRHPFKMYYKTGLTRDGRIVASQIRVVADGGAYAQSTPAVMNKAAALSNGPYRIPNVWVDVIGVYTNNTPSGAMRGFGATQMHVGNELHMDLCAERLGLDPLEFRRINAMRDGDTTHTGQVIPGHPALLETIDAAAGTADWKTKDWNKAEDRLGVIGL